MTKTHYCFALIVLCFPILLSSSCKKGENPPDETGATPYKLEIPRYFPTDFVIPADNPMTVEGVKLGHYLYYDGRLSGKADEGMPQSCSSCHIQQYGFTNGIGRAIGTTGLQTPNTTMPHVNLLWNPGTLSWIGRASSIEEVVKVVVVVPNEFASTPEKVVAAISKVPMYPPMFKAAFGTETVTMDRIAKAIAQFVRTMISSNSKFDQVIRGEAMFTPEESIGYDLFTSEKADCFHCHGAPGNVLMTTNLFYNNALDSTFDELNDRYSITGSVNDIGAYKAPSLRNIEVSGPYMHDGRFQTLDQVIDFYSEGLKYSKYANPLMKKLNPPFGHGAELTPIEKADLKAFLLTLTDTVFLNNKAFSNPF